MKNILIPTLFDQDTVSAVKAALKHANGKPARIILMSVCEIPDYCSSAQFLRKIKSETPCSEKAVLEVCRNLVSTENAQLKIHSQYGVSSPVIKNLLEHFEAELIVLTPSYKAAQKRIHRQCCKILANAKSPILHLNSNFNDSNFSKAMYVEQTQSRYHLEDLQQMVRDQFDFTIVSQTKLMEGQDSQELTPLLSEAISKNNINLLIETRKPEKIRLKNKEKINFNETLDVPVLSFYEEIV